MAQINSFDRRNLKVLRVELDAAIAAIGSKYGIAIKTGNARFNSDNVTFKLEASVISNGQVKNKGVIALERFFPQYVGKLVTLSGGKKGKVIEYHSRKHKFPFIVETVSGKRYKVPEYSVK